MGSSRSRADDRVERAVLALLLTGDPPGCQPVEQLVEQIGDRTAALHALERLRAVGLAERAGDLVSPTAAAKRFDELSI